VDIYIIFGIRGYILFIGIRGSPGAPIGAQTPQEGCRSAESQHFQKPAAGAAQMRAPAAGFGKRGKSAVLGVVQDSGGALNTVFGAFLPPSGTKK